MRDGHQVLAQLRGATAAEKEARRQELMVGCPFPDWPDALISSAFPLVQFIGVSPGNSPSEGQERAASGATRFVAAPHHLTWGDPQLDLPLHERLFYYPDGRGYWDKVRSLGFALVQLLAPGITQEEDAVSLLSHLNLATGCAGNSTSGDLQEEPDTVAWVSSLTYRLGARVIIGCGIKGKMKWTHSENWKKGEGYAIDWQRPDDTSKASLGARVRSLDYWTRRNRYGESCIFMMLPNHPSRVPFTGKADGEAWLALIDLAVETTRRELGLTPV